MSAVEHTPQNKTCINFYNLRLKQFHIYIYICIYLFIYLLSIFISNYTVSGNILIKNTIMFIEGS